MGKRGCPADSPGSKEGGDSVIMCLSQAEVNYLFSVIKYILNQLTSTLLFSGVMGDAVLGTEHGVVRDKMKAKGKKHPLPWERKRQPEVFSPKI